MTVKRKKSLQVGRSNHKVSKQIALHNIRAGCEVYLLCRLVEMLGCFHYMRLSLKCSYHLSDSAKRRKKGGTRTIGDWSAYLREHPDRRKILKCFGSNSDGQRMVTCKLCSWDLVPSEGIIQKHFSSARHKKRAAASARQPLTVQQRLQFASSPSALPRSKVTQLASTFFMAYNIPFAKAEAILSDEILVDLCEYSRQRGIPFTRKTFHAQLGHSDEYVVEVLRSRLKDRWVSIVSDESRDNRGVRVLVVVFNDGAVDVVGRVVAFEDDESITAARVTEEKMETLRQMEVDLSRVTADVGDNAAYEQLSIRQFAQAVSEAGGNAVTLRCLSHGFNLAVQTFLRHFPELTTIASAFRGLCSGHPGHAEDSRRHYINRELGGGSSSALDYADTRWVSKLKAIVLLVGHWDKLCPLLCGLPASTFPGDSELCRSIANSCVKVKSHYAAEFLEPFLALSAASQNANTFLVPHLVQSKLCLGSAMELAEMNDDTSVLDRIRLVIPLTARGSMSDLSSSDTESLVTCMRQASAEFVSEFNKTLRHTLDVHGQRLACIPGQARELLYHDGMFPNEPPHFGRPCRLGVMQAWKRYELRVRATSNAPNDILSAQEFWRSFSESDEYARELSTLASRALSICTTNAGAERVFSIMNCMETSRRLRSSDEYMKAELLSSCNRDVVLDTIRATLDRAKTATSEPNPREGAESADNE